MSMLAEKIDEPRQFPRLITPVKQPVVNLDHCLALSSKLVVPEFDGAPLPSMFWSRRPTHDANYLTTKNFADAEEPLFRSSDRGSTGIFSSYAAAALLLALISGGALYYKVVGADLFSPPVILEARAVPLTPASTGPQLYTVATLNSTGQEFEQDPVWAETVTQYRDLLARTNAAKLYRFKETENTQLLGQLELWMRKSAK
jgi:hypothetical protein